MTRQGLRAVHIDLQKDLAAISQIAAIPAILSVICRTTGMGFAAVARVTEERWVACQVLDNMDFGLRPGDELKVETTICDEIRQTGRAVIIDSVSEDGLYRNHDTPALYGFQSYISVPIILPNGSFFGTLCAIDVKPHLLNTPETVGMFELFAELIAFHLDANDKLASSEAELFNERHASELREQFIAVMGHDLRNPLASIDAGIGLLQRERPSEKAATILGHMRNSAARMSSLIDNVLDLARARLGGGFSLNHQSDAQLEPILDQVVMELRSVLPERIIETRFGISAPVDCDPTRIGQLFSNLLGNALMHGAAAEPVLAEAIVADGQFRLTVSNRGEPIAPEAMKLLFQPFYRGHMGANLQGLGLGLFIAAEVARAHGGTLEAFSAPDMTSFIFQMPLSPTLS